MTKTKFLIFQPTKSAMQSGLGNSNKWCLSNNTTNVTYINSIFGWTGTTSSEKNVTLFFDSLESAIRFADEKKMKFDVIKTKKRKVIKKSYSENFVKK